MTGHWTMEEHMNAGHMNITARDDEDARRIVAGLTGREDAGLDRGKRANIHGEIPFYSYDVVIKDVYYAIKEGDRLVCSVNSKDDAQEIITAVNIRRKAYKNKGTPPRAVFSDCRKCGLKEHPYMGPGTIVDLCPSCKVVYGDPVPKVNANRVIPYVPVEREKAADINMMGFVTTEPAPGPGPYHHINPHDFQPRELTELPDGRHINPGDYL